MKKAIITVLLLGMLIVPLVSLQGSGGMVPTASASYAGSYPSWIFDPPWVLEWRNEMERNYGYYDANGRWVWVRPYPYPQQQQQGRPSATAAPQYGRSGFSGIPYSTEVLKQAWIGGRSIQLRLFGDNDQRSTFKLSLGTSSTGGIRLTMTDQRYNEAVKPVFDSAALQFLIERGIDELVTVTKDGTTTTYNLDTLRSMAGN